MTFSSCTRVGPVETVTFSSRTRVGPASDPCRTRVGPVGPSCARASIILRSARTHPILFITKQRPAPAQHAIEMLRECDKHSPSFSYVITDKDTSKTFNSTIFVFLQALYICRHNRGLVPTHSDPFFSPTTAPRSSTADSRIRTLRTLRTSTTTTVNCLSHSFGNRLCPQQQGRGHRGNHHAGQEPHDAKVSGRLAHPMRHHAPL